MPKVKPPEYRSEPLCKWCGRRKVAHDEKYGRLRSRHTFVPDPETVQDHQ